MEVRHYLKIYSDKNNTAITRQVKTRSLKEDALLKLYNGEQKVEYFSRFESKRSFGENFAIYFVSPNMFVKNHNLSCFYNIFDIDDTEKSWAYNDMGGLADGTIQPTAETEKKLNIKYNFVYLANAEEKILCQANLDGDGFSLEEIDNFINAINEASQRLSDNGVDFYEIVNLLISGYEEDNLAKNYYELAKVLGEIPKYKNLGKDNVQIKLSDVTNPKTEFDPKQKQ